MEVDADEIFDVCPGVTSFFFTTDKLLEVKTKTAKQPENPKYSYSVSSGRIVGTGANVSWDLNGTRVGKHQIRVNVRGRNFRQKFIKEITVKPLPCYPICVCPNLNVISPSQKVKAGKTAVFAIKIDGGSQTTLTYNWTISEGKIIKGQGTPKIKVATKGLSGKAITATVEISGDFCAECYRTASSAAEIY